MKKLLIAAVMLLTFSVAAQAALFQVGSTPVTTVSSCGTTELTGKIVFATTSTSSPVLTGTITINYGVPITSVSDLLITNAAGVNLVTSGEVANISTTGPGGELSLGHLVLAITPGANLGLPAEIDVNGVRVNIAGTAGLTSLSATVTATQNAFVGGQTSVVVINSIASAIDSVTVANGQNSISAITPNTPTPGVPVVKVTEGFLGAWIPSNNAAQGPIIALTFSGIPTGVTLTFDASVTTVDALGNGVSTFTLVSATGGAPAAGSNVLSSASAPATVYYRLTTAGTNAPVVKEVLNVPATIGFTATGPRPLAQGPITVSADMSPKTTDLPVGSTYVPQYSGTACQKTGAKPVATIVGANTALLMPYAVTQAASGYNTGIAIANTTNDPFNATTAQSGTLTFSFFPQVGPDPAPYTTGATTPGQGLCKDTTTPGCNQVGALPAGGLYTVLLTQLLQAAGVTGDFSGYIFVQCNFTNAHGQYFISDFEAFTNGALMLVVNPTVAGRAQPESLGN